MSLSPSESAGPRHYDEPVARSGVGLWPLTGYFLRLGTWGFGGPVALVGFMHRDLVERRRWITEETYKLSLALAQIMPGPLAAQVAIAIGYFEGGILGATCAGLAFVLPSFLMVVAISLAYVAYGGLWWMQALFYAIGATVIAIIAIAAYKLARSTNKRDPLLWGIFALLTAVTVWAQAELAEFFILAGLVVLLVRAWPGWRRGLLMGLGGVGVGGAIWWLEAWLRHAGTAADSTDVLAQILLFFTKAGAFVFGSGLAIIPFLHQGVVQQFGWLNEHQFLDAVAVAMITPGPVVITVAFIGFLVAGLAGADHGSDRHLPARLCVYHCPRPLVQTPPRQSAAEGLRGRGHGGRHRRHHGRRRAARRAGDRRLAHGAHRARQPRGLMALQSPGTAAGRALRTRGLGALAAGADGVMAPLARRDRTRRWGRPEARWQRRSLCGASNHHTGLSVDWR